MNWGYAVEILCLERGQSLGEPVAILTVRPNFETKPILFLFNREQCVRIRDSLDDLLNDRESWLHMSKKKQKELQI